MALQTKLQQQGSPLSRLNGGNLPTLVGSTRASRLHASTAGVSGYSLNGNFAPFTTRQQNQYVPQTIAVIPPPSTLDINGADPLGALRNPNTPSINNTFVNGKYEDNLPPGVGSI